jgi:hypothetical protein
VAALRIHGTNLERPADRLAQERPYLLGLPPAERLVSYRREDRRVGRDGLVAYERAWYSVPWRWAGQIVRIQADPVTVEVWRRNERLAVHPRAAVGPAANRAWPVGPVGPGDGRPLKEPLAIQLQSVAVEQRPLTAYAALVAAPS